MGKKIAAEMAKHRETFIKGAGEKGILPSIAEQIFEQAAKFAGYGFNKGHAAAYAQVAYQTAYLKANYPVEFLAASMTLDIGTTDRLNIFRQEAQRLGIRVAAAGHQPLRSRLRLRCARSGVIYYALAAVKGVGRQAMDHVVAQREAGGPFRSHRRFRAPPRFEAGQQARLRKPRARRRLRCAQSPNRRQLVESADAILNDAAAHRARARERASRRLFGEAAAAEDLRLAPIDDWLPHERLGEEFSAIGFYLSGHPLDAYDAALKRLGA